MRGSSSNTFGHTGQSSQYGAEEQSIATASTASASGSEAEDRGAGETQLRSPTRRRRRGLKISCELCKARKVPTFHPKFFLRQHLLIESY